MHFLFIGLLLGAGVSVWSAPCKLTPLHTGVCQIGKDHVLGAGHTAEERMPFVIYSFLIEGSDGQKALVDLGPKSLDYCNRMFLRHGFFRDLGPDHPSGKRYPDNIVQPRGNVLNQLKELGIAPGEMGHIVFTHLHSDHHGMHDGKDGGAAEDFPGAMLHVSGIGWEDNLRKREGGRWNSYVDFAFSDFLLRRQQEGKAVFRDDAEVLPGVRTVYLGGHSVCSQAVLVETAAGTAILTSDDLYLYQLLEEGIMPQIRTSKENYRAAIRRLVDLARDGKGILVPSHDPVVWEVYERAGVRWLEELRRLSDRAIGRYLEREQLR